MHTSVKKLAYWLVSTSEGIQRFPALLRAHMQPLGIRCFVILRFLRTKCKIYSQTKTKSYGLFRSMGPEMTSYMLMHMAFLLLRASKMTQTVPVPQMCSTEDRLPSFEHDPPAWLAVLVHLPY